MTQLSIYEVLRRSALQFRKYEHLHGTKAKLARENGNDTQDFLHKEATNREFAEMCEEALARKVFVSPEGKKFTYDDYITMVEAQARKDWIGQNYVYVVLSALMENGIIKCEDRT